MLNLFNNVRTLAIQNGATEANAAEVERFIISSTKNLGFGAMALHLEDIVVSGGLVTEYAVILLDEVDVIDIPTAKALSYTIDYADNLHKVRVYSGDTNFQNSATITTARSGPPVVASDENNLVQALIMQLTEEAAVADARLYENETTVDVVINQSITIPANVKLYDVNNVVQFYGSTQTTNSFYSKANDSQTSDEYLVCFTASVDNGIEQHDYTLVKENSSCAATIFNGHLLALAQSNISVENSSQYDIKMYDFTEGQIVQFGSTYTSATPTSGVEQQLIEKVVAIEDTLFGVWTRGFSQENTVIRAFDYDGSTFTTTHAIDYADASVYTFGVRVIGGKLVVPRKTGFATHGLDFYDYDSATGFTLAFSLDKSAFTECDSIYVSAHDVRTGKYFIECYIGDGMTWCIGTFDIENQTFVTEYTIPVDPDTWEPLIPVTLVGGVGSLSLFSGGYRAVRYNAGTVETLYSDTTVGDGLSSFIIIPDE